MYRVAVRVEQKVSIGKVLEFGNDDKLCSIRVERY